MPAKFPKWVPFLVLLVVLAAVGFYWLSSSSAQAAGPIQASGAIETVYINVATEMTGRVAEVFFGSGQSVASGEVILRLDDEILSAQRARVQAAVQTAEENLRLAEVGQSVAQAALETAQAAATTVEAQSQVEALGAQQGLDDLEENWALVSAQAEQAVAAANRRVREAQYQLDNFTIPANQQDLSALAAVEEMEARLEQARQNFEPYKYYSSGNTTREDLKEAMDEAQADYDAAVKRLEYETEVARSRAQLQRALDELIKLEDGPDPDQVALLQARLDAAQAAPGQAQAAVRQAELGGQQAQVALDQARALLAQAQAELQTLDVQMERLTVYAPASGVVMSRNVEPGEVVMAGAPLMVLGKLDELTITVYVTEDRYGQLQVGAPAWVDVDSFPGRRFEAQVIRIADKAEFTPRNVQTEEGRRTTVFAVELKLENAEGLLKPGMPADVTFGR